MSSNGNKIKDLGVLGDFEVPPSIKEDPNNIEIIIDLFFDGVQKLILKHNPSIGYELSSFLSHPNPKVKDKVREFIRGQGENSMEATASLFGVMLGECTPQQLQMISPAIEAILAHHLLEVASDSLDSGVEISPERVEFLNRFNNLAAPLALGAASPEEVECADLNIGEPEESWIGRAIVNRVIDSSLGEKMGWTGDMLKDLHLSNLKMSDLLRLNLFAVNDIHDHLELDSPDPNFDLFIQESLARRYISAQMILDPNRGYANMDLPSALLAREDAILIKVTMGILIREIAQNDSSIAEFLRENRERVEIAIRMSARLIGIWNDIGSPLTRIPANSISDFVRTIRMENPNAYISEALAPGGYRERVSSAGATTSELRQLRVDGTSKLDAWRPFTQLLKDAVKGERNLVLDLGGRYPDMTDDWRFREVTLISLNQMAKNLESALARSLETFPDPIKDVILNATLFHSQLYAGGDYYGRKISTGSLPIMNGQIDAQDFRLHGDYSNEIFEV